MKNFNFCVPTDIRFGRDQIECLPTELKKLGTSVLLVYGGGSIKLTGLYQKIMALLKDDFIIYELPGITPNPRINAVRAGVRICKKNKVDVILAVGGGSCIDASKAIAAGALYDGDPWDLVLDKTKVKGALPIADVLTISATGSEMNPGAVISNEETKEKLELNTPVLYPHLSILDPTYLFTLPKRQTAAGTADIISHVFEQYFQKGDGAFITDRLCESVLKTCFHYGPIAMAEPDNYEARSNLMWAATLGLNHILTVGKGGAWSCHPMEHELSAFYDITHGVGLAILTPAWMRYVLEKDPGTAARFAMYGRNVWGIMDNKDGDEYAVGYEVDAEAATAAAKKAIERTADFFREMGLPSKLSEVGIGSEHFEEMAKEAVRTSGIASRSYVPLDASDIVAIYRSCE